VSCTSERAQRPTLRVNTLLPPSGSEWPPPHTHSCENLKSYNCEGIMKNSRSYTWVGSKRLTVLPPYLQCLQSEAAG
jgi:hypothetical protein